MYTELELLGPPQSALTKVGSRSEVALGTQSTDVCPAGQCRKCRPGQSQNKTSEVKMTSSLSLHDWAVTQRSPGRSRNHILRCQHLRMAAFPLRDYLKSTSASCKGRLVLGWWCKWPPTGAPRLLPALYKTQILWFSLASSSLWIYDGPWLVKLTHSEENARPCHCYILCESVAWKSDLIEAQPCGLAKLRAGIPPKVKSIYTTHIPMTPTQGN